jgi:hypothetical protein
MAPRSIRKALAGFLEPRACALAGACAGALAGWFSFAAGLLLGGMLDVARIEARARRRIASFLERPEGEAPPEPLEGYAAAACLALRGDWPGLADPEARRALFERSAPASASQGPGARREAERIVDVAARCARADLPALARRLATSDASLARGLLAEWAFALSALCGARLDPGAELSLRAALGDCGLGARELLDARLKAFPGERDPWTVLGLSPGAPRSEVKRAYRRLSRLFHPDAARASDGAPPGDVGERFRELQAAYSELTRGRV